MEGPPEIREAHPGDIGAIRALADRTWRTCYPGILSPEQIDYMLRWMYAPETLRAEIGSQQIGYLIAFPPAGGAPGAFAAHGPGEGPGEWFLHKLYVDPLRQRGGLGSALIGEVLRRAAAAGAGTLSLRVNRGNAGAIAVYRRRGFAIVGEVCADIGGGFVMDDYVMSRPTACPEP